MWFRSVLVAVVLGAGLAACSSPSKPTGSPTTRTLTGVTVSGVAPAVGATLPFTATANWSDGTHEDVTNSAAWASSNSAVLTVAATGMVTGVAAGSATVSATYQAKTGISPVTVVAPTCNFTVSPLSFSLPKTGGTVTINVTMAGAPCAWDALTGHAFMRVVSGGSGVGNGSIVVAMDPNTDLARQGSVIVSHRFVVLFNQAQADCVVSATPTPASISALQSVVKVLINAPDGCTWHATLPSRLVTLVTIGTYSGNGEVNVVIGPNGSGATRLNEITIEQLKVVMPQDVPHGTYFFWTSDDGGVHDFVAQAPQHPISASAPSTSEAQFSITAPSFLSNQLFPWTLIMRAPNGQPLVPGTYLNADLSGGTPGLPYLAMGPNGFICSAGTGSFVVKEAVYGPGPSIVRFWATFQRQCTSERLPLVGEISFGR